MIVLGLTIGRLAEMFPSGLAIRYPLPKLQLSASWYTHCQIHVFTSCRTFLSLWSLKFARIVLVPRHTQQSIAAVCARKFRQFKAVY